MKKFNVKSAGVKLLIAVFGVLLIAAIPTAIFLSHNSSQYTVFVPEPKPAVTTLEIISGSDVQIKNIGGIFAASKTGQEIKEGDTVKTGPDSQAQILHTTGSATRIDANSEVVVENLSTETKTTVSIFIKAGQVWNRVAKLFGGESYETKTSTTVATVRGTSYGHGAGNPGEEDKVIVTKGAVKSDCVNNNQSSELKEDQQGLFNCTKEAPKVTSIDETTKSDVWVELNNKEDEKIEAKYGSETFNDIKPKKEETNNNSFLDKLLPDFLTKRDNDKENGLENIKDDKKLNDTIKDVLNVAPKDEGTTKTKKNTGGIDLNPKVENGSTIDTKPKIYDTPAPTPTPIIDTKTDVKILDNIKINPTPTPTESPKTGTMGIQTKETTPEKSIENYKYTGGY